MFCCVRVPQISKKENSLDVSSWKGEMSLPIGLQMFDPLNSNFEKVKIRPIDSLKRDFYAGKSRRGWLHVV